MKKGQFASNKILKHLPVLNDYLQGRPVRPILVEIDLTNMCASACPWCFGYKDRVWSRDVIFADEEAETDRLESSVDGVRRLLDELAELEVRAVTWTGGGDPTQHKGLSRVMEHAAENGLKQALISHGVIDVSHLIHHCEWVRFSVDAATVEGYALQHGKPQHFALVLENVAGSARRKAAENLSTTVGVGFLTCKTSWSEIIPFAKLWSDVPIDYIQYRPLQDAYGEPWESDTPVVIEYIEAAKGIDPRVTWSEPKYWAIAKGLRGQTDLCHGQFLEAAISADSKVYTCCHHKGVAKYAIGDLREESFAAIWERHQASGEFRVNGDCPTYCRHYGTNAFIENEVLADRVHPEFI